MYYVKRRIGKGNCDYLMDFDPQWGTSCCISKSRAMTFETKELAEKARDKAQAEIKLGIFSIPLPKFEFYIMKGN